MKQWLKRAGPILLLFAAFFALFVIEENRISALSQTKSADDCPLCRLSNLYHAPLIMNLVTGEVCEIRIYEPHHTLAFALAEEQKGGYSTLRAGGGLVAFCDATAHTASEAMPEYMSSINKNLFCSGCRSLISAAGAEGYAIINSYASEPLSVYSILEGAEYDIRNYHICVSRDGRERLIVDVTGTM